MVRKGFSGRAAAGRGRRLRRSVKRNYPSASIINRERVVFNISGNNYRIIVMVKYEFHVVYIRFLGTHAECDKVDAETV